MSLSDNGGDRSGDAKSGAPEPKGPEAKSSKVSGKSGSSRKFRSSSGQLRQSSIFRAAEWLGRGGSVWSLPVSAVMRRRGLDRKSVV